MNGFDSAQLETLVAVLDEESFEGAAHELRISPSAVSQRIRALEQQVGRSLVRRSRPVTATAAGQVLLRLARQQLLLRSDALAELGHAPGRQMVTLVVNADSLSTWALAPLTEGARELGVLLDIRRDDEDLSTAGLRDGSAMAAVTSVREPVPGCSVTRLGTMNYHPMASAEFAERWFGEGITAEALDQAPLVNFDRTDRLQQRWMRRHTRRALNPPVHYVPESATFASAVRLGLGWGMIPTQQRSTDLVELAPGEVLGVSLFWQQWRMQSATLDGLRERVLRSAKQQLG